MSDDTKGVYDAVTYFIENDHRKIALLQGNKEFESTVYRKRGYIRALEDNNIPINEEYILSVDMIWKVDMKIWKSYLN